MSGSSLTVSKLEIECSVPAATPAPERIENKFRNIAREHLNRVLTDLLKPLNEAGEEVVLIKCLEMEFDIDLLLSRQQIAQVWANKIKSALLQAMNGNATSNVVVFENQDCYIKSALLDIVRGRAPHLWYYNRFNGLWALPVSAAVRTLLLDDRDRGLAALIRMQDAELVEVCAALSEQDARRVLQHLFNEDATYSITPADATSFVSSVKEVHTLAYGLDDRPEQQSLLLACLAVSRQPDSNPSAAIQCAHHLSILMRLFNAFPDTFTRITGLVIRCQTEELQQWLPAQRIAELAPLLHMDGRLAGSFAELLVPGPGAAKKKSFQPEQETRFTRFGNALLLLPQIDNLPLAALQSFQPLHDQPALPLIRLLVLCLCQGVEKFVAAFRDPVLRDLCGIGPEIVLTEVVPWLNNQMTQRRLLNVYDTLEKDINRDGHPLQYSAWSHADKWIVVNAETQKGCWVNLSIADRHAVLLEDRQTQNDECQEDVRRDFNSLWLANRWGLNDEACALLGVLAQGTMKSFAYRLPGFANSTVPYLLHNFLSMSVTLVAEESRIVAYLSRVPMSVMLNMTGMNRGTAHFPQFDQRPIHLAESG